MIDPPARRVNLVRQASKRTAGGHRPRPRSETPYSERASDAEKPHNVRPALFIVCPGLAGRPACAAPPCVCVCAAQLGSAANNVVFSVYLMSENRCGAHTCTRERQRHARSRHPPSVKRGVNYRLYGGMDECVRVSVEQEYDGMEECGAWIGEEMI